MCKSIYQLEYAGNKNAIKFRNFLYGSASDEILLDRKRDRFYNDWIDNKPRSTRCRQVVGKSISGDDEIFLEAIADCKFYGFRGSDISSCLSGRQRSHKNYTWEYAKSLI